MTVNPNGKAEVTVSYTLPSTMKAGDYKLLIQKQPGVEKQDVKISIGGQTMYDGVFDKDKEYQKGL